MLPELQPGQDGLVDYSGSDDREFLVGGGFVASTLLFVGPNQRAGHDKLLGMTLRCR